MKYLVIGCGRMAAAIVFDFIHFGNASKIICCDKSVSSLKDMKKRFKSDTFALDFQIIGAHEKEKLFPIMQEVDGVLSAVPYDYNYDLTKWAIENSCHFVDLGGNNSVVDKQFRLHDDALKAGVGIIPDCGLAPGMTSVIVSHAVSRMNRTDKVEIRVGGLPLEPQGPLNYNLVFSVHGLINEYKEPALILKNGKVTQVQSMTGLEKIKFPKPFGEVEAFYTSGGISTLPYTYKDIIQHIDYKTIRYQGHCALFKGMIDMGFAEEEPITIDGRKFLRRTVFEELLVQPLTYRTEDVVLIRVTVEGRKDNKPVIAEYQAIEYSDTENNLTAMMRTTAFPAALTLEMLTDGRIAERGVLRQEKAIPSDVFMKELERRNIRFDISEDRL